MSRTVGNARQLHAIGRAVRLTLLATAALSLAGCIGEFASASCKKVKADILQVGPGETCTFRYDEGDVARYVVVVTGQPSNGKASGDGKYLTYVARPGFKGEDRLTIKVERRGVGHVQWRTLQVKVKVGPVA